MCYSISEAVSHSYHDLVFWNIGYLVERQSVQILGPEHNSFIRNPTDVPEFFIGMERDEESGEILFINRTKSAYSNWNGKGKGRYFKMKRNGQWEATVGIEDEQIPVAWRYYPY